VGIVNRRNAVVGYLVWQTGKFYVKHKAREAVPRVDLEERRPNKSAIALFAAAVGGVVFFWRRRAGAGDESGE
jgi:hypothetical protein